MTEQSTQFTHRPVRTGAMTLLITAVLICLAVLAVLALSTARADLAMADKALTGLQSQAQTETLGQEYLARLDAALKAGTDLPKEAATHADGTILANLSANDGTLEIVVRPRQATSDDPAAYEILTWRLSTSWEPDQSLDLWNGM